MVASEQWRQRLGIKFTHTLLYGLSYSLNSQTIAPLTNLSSLLALQGAQSLRNCGGPLYWCKPVQASDRRLHLPRVTNARFFNSELTFPLVFWHVSSPFCVFFGWSNLCLINTVSGKKELISHNKILVYMYIFCN